LGLFIAGNSKIGLDYKLFGKLWIWNRWWRHTKMFV